MMTFRKTRVACPITFHRLHSLHFQRSRQTSTRFPISARLDYRCRPGALNPSDDKGLDRITVGVGERHLDRFSSGHN